MTLIPVEMSKYFDFKHGFLPFLTFLGHSSIDFFFKGENKCTWILHDIVLEELLTF